LVENGQPLASVERYNPGSDSARSRGEDFILNKQFGQPESEAAGDYWRGQVVPKIRLPGQWLERAGFKPGCRVAIEPSGQGILTLKF
jgi:Toxin SymE, type I toxin-antitoxin system